MLKFKVLDSLSDFQDFIQKVYGLPDDRLYSIWDILVQMQRFTMRALKGIRKNDLKKIQTNLLISFSWSMAICNRLHIEIDDQIWKRYPGVCSYCGGAPCICKKIKPKERKKLKISNAERPISLVSFQQMFEKIYPSQGRTLNEAGVHLAEEMGEVSEAIHNYLGQHKLHQFEEVKAELADYISCVFGVANSAHINTGSELAKIFNKNCHVCHKAPCACTFTDVTKLST